MERGGVRGLPRLIRGSDEDVCILTERTEILEHLWFDIAGAFHGPRDRRLTTASSFERCRSVCERPRTIVRSEHPTSRLASIMHPTTPVRRELTDVQLSEQ
jgi:hypothetical protein